MRDGCEKPVWRIEEWNGKNLAREVEAFQRLIVVRHRVALRSQHAQSVLICWGQV